MRVSRGSIQPNYPLFHRILLFFLPHFSDRERGAGRKSRGLLQGEGGGVQGRHGGRQSAAPAEDARGHEPVHGVALLPSHGGEGR